MFSKFYLIHVKNPKDVLKGRVADLEQVGPFTFAKKLHRQVYGFENNETEITFRTSTTFHYLPELSNDTAIDRNITILNLPMAVSDAHHLLAVVAADAVDADHALSTCDANAVSLRCFACAVRQAMLGATIHMTRGTFKGVMALNTLPGTIKNMNQKLLVDLTPRQFLIDGYDVPIIPSMKALAGLASENEDPNGRFSLMSAVSSLGRSRGFDPKRNLFYSIHENRGMARIVAYGSRTLAKTQCPKQDPLKAGTT